MQNDECGDMSNKGHVSTGCFPCGCLKALWSGEHGVLRPACVFQLVGSLVHVRGHTFGDTRLGTHSQGYTGSLAHQPPAPCCCLAGQPPLGRVMGRQPPWVSP